jgi:hypothetical protein
MLMQLNLGDLTNQFCYLILSNMSSAILNRRCQLSMQETLEGLTVPW